MPASAPAASGPPQRWLHWWDAGVRWRADGLAQGACAAGRSGTSPALFQSFILLTNYQFFITEFITWGQAKVRGSLPRPTSTLSQRSSRGGAPAAARVFAAAACVQVAAKEDGYVKLVGPHDTVLADGTSIRPANSIDS